MATISYIKEHKDKTFLLLGIAEEGEVVGYTVRESDYVLLGSPPVGCELSEADMDSVIYSAEALRAEKKALSLLALADNNARSLKMKLLKSGIRKEIADQTLEKMIGLGYIDERRQLLRLVERLANESLLGIHKINSRLVSRGYSASDIRAAVQSLIDDSVVDFSRNAQRLFEKKLGEDFSEDEKQTLLYKYGYKR